MPRNTAPTRSVPACLANRQLCRTGSVALLLTIGKAREGHVRGPARGPVCRSRLSRTNPATGPIDPPRRPIEIPQTGCVAKHDPPCLSRTRAIEISARQPATPVSALAQSTDRGSTES